MTLCSMTDCCPAVNVIGNQGVRCELTTGLSEENEMEDADNSELLVLGEMNDFSHYWNKKFSLRCLHE